MTLINPVKSEIDEALNRAMSLSPEEIAALSYEDALYLWRNLVFVAERLELNADSAKQRAKMASRADELFYTIAEYETKNPPNLNKPLNIFAVYSIRAVWNNFLLARDKGYTPYFLSRATGGRCVFFFVDENDPLPVADAMPGAEFIRQNDTSPEAYAEFIKEHIDEIDILVTDNIIADSFAPMPLFKSLKPDGKILHVTDVNRFFYDIKSEEEIFGRIGDLLKLPDVYTAASHLGCDIMNADPRFPKPVFFNSNAYLPDKNTDEVTADQKENIIMTAGRIGSFQKNNTPLIRSFALLANDFPDWKLILAGSYEETDRKKLMNEAFRGLKYSPEIFKRIIFTGNLNKTELYKYYAKAKIFVTTSLKEGGTPNVFSEALANSCFMIIPDRLDAAFEMTNAFGRNIGVSYEARKYTKIYTDMSVIVDENAEAISLANTLAAVIPQLTEEFFEAHIKKCREYAENDFDYKKNSLKLMHLLCDIAERQNLHTIIRL
jgi:glycosyltransferase involved in cell wall biosynthesis